MADTRPTKINIFRASCLCVLLLIAPKKFLAVEDADDKIHQERTDKQKPERSALLVRRAFLKSLLLVVAAGVFGGSIGVSINKIIGCASPALIMWLQISGALILLWGTLFVRGWEIQTYSGVRLTERVNQWLYRFLYFIGSAIFILSLVWQQCQTKRPTMCCI